MKSRQTSIACSVIRGGTSRGAYFLSKDLPSDAKLRDQVLTAVMGGPDALQIDGLGGGHSLTSKVAIVGPSSTSDADVDYLFLQVAPDNSFVSTAQNCGNILSGVAPFAIEQGLVQAGDDTTTIRVNMINSGSQCELTIATPGGLVEYSGETAIDGVPGESSAIICDFLDIAGSITGALLPTGNVVDSIDGINVTCIDNGMPVVCARASDFGLSGNEAPQDLDADLPLKEALEHIRLQVGPMMNLGDVSKKSVPKMCLVAEPIAGGNVLTRMFIPHECHRSIGVLGAVTVATACLLPGAVPDGVSTVPAGKEKTFNVEHPSGAFHVRLAIDEEAAPEAAVVKAGVIRTARTLMRGEVFVSPHIWSGE
jgi:4-oxalomesaconate tautomerase